MHHRDSIRVTRAGSPPPWPLSYQNQVKSGVQSLDYMALSTQPDISDSCDAFTHHNTIACDVKAWWACITCITCIGTVQGLGWTLLATGGDCRTKPSSYWFSRATCILVAPRTAQRCHRISKSLLTMIQSWVGSPKLVYKSMHCHYFWLRLVLWATCLNLVGTQPPTRRAPFNEVNTVLSSN